MKPIKIIIVDDNDAYRSALKAILVNMFDVNIIGEVSNSEQFWKIKDLYTADLILMDVMMPVVDGIKLTKEILWKYKELKVIAITLHYEKIYLKSLVEAGFWGCVFKNDIFIELECALMKVLSGKRYFPKDILVDKID